MSERLSERWAQIRKDGRKTIVPYITPGFPLADATDDLVVGLAEAGADIVEIGIPFSDPLADGPTIQSASHIALQNGITPSTILRAVERIRRRTDIPLVLMGYVNPIMHLGLGTFMRDAAQAGVDGLIIPDLPPEESGSFRIAASDNGVSMTFLVAPTSTDPRIRSIDALSTDFSYCVSIRGVTGNRTRFEAERSLDTFLARVRKNAKKPFVVGFGIATREDIQRVTKHADGAVVGTALLKVIGSQRTVRDVCSSAVAFYTSLKG